MFSINDFNSSYFDEDGVIWTSNDETMTITDPFLAVVVITDNPNIAKPLFRVV